MKELVLDIWNNRTSALSVLRGLGLGVALYVGGLEDAPKWLEVGVAIISGGMFGVTGNKKP